MSRRRRAVVLAVLAVLLGGLAASDVGGREARLRQSLGAPVGVLVAQSDVKAGEPLAQARLALRRVPARYAPTDAFASPGDIAGLKAAVAIPAGTDLSSAMVADPAQLARAAVPVGPGQRVAEIVAIGSPATIVRGSRVDVLVTSEKGAGEGVTTLALQDAEVLASAPGPAAGGNDDPGPRVALSLRVSLREAVYLASAQSFARALRVLPRGAGDRGRARDGLSVDSGL